MKIYCSGIGGIGLSAYASLQKEMGNEVLGSDRHQTPLTQELEAHGIQVVFNQDGSQVPDDCDLFVFTEAIPISAPERLRASELGIVQMSYPEALSKLTDSYTVIAVCGTHGKSSTTAMAARLLIETGRDPTVVVGTKMTELGGRNWRRGDSSLFLIEACEYRKSFHFYNPQIIIMTNCDGDHFDYYKSLELYQESFVDFLKRLPQSGTVITHLQDADCDKVARASDRDIIDADQFPLIDLQTPGLHMKQNAQLALALAEKLTISQEDAIAALAPFAGTWRRMEQKGYYRDDVLVIDDYAHHPKEIRATLNALRSRYPKRRIVCVYQPHTHNRTIELYSQFTESFTDADLVLVTNVYDARSDTETETVDMPKFVEDIAKNSNMTALTGGTLAAAKHVLETSVIQPEDILIFMGAGDITDLAGEFAIRTAMASRESE
ncbi:MAG: UDP-N-acetylmuramate--alanine ligase [Candidatus Peribacteria bacterium]|nr:UDP-N-acetylmuramate--alanine ligase [Candidatus Peribacteria bacterium]